MSRDRIVIEARTSYGPYYLQWIIDDDTGAEVGDHRKTVTEKDLKDAIDADNGDFEFLKGEMTAATLGLDRPHPHRGYEFETVTAAKKALAAINVGIKDKSSKPWPEWALKAKAAGWAPPKKWSP